MFRYYMKLGAELVQLMDKFVPLSRIGIFRNERTRSTPIGPKTQVLVCFHTVWVHFGFVLLLHETWCKTN